MSRPKKLADPFDVIDVEKKGRKPKLPGPPGRKYEKVAIDYLKDKLPPSINRKQSAKYKKQIQTKKIRIAEPKRTAFRMVQIRGDYYRICSTSATVSQACNFFKMYKNGELLVVLPTTMRDPLSYIKKWPNSKWRQIIVNEIRNHGVTEEEANQIIDAPVVFV